MNEVAVRLGWGETEIGAMWGRSAYLFSCTIETPDDVWAMENVATTVEHRGRGLASALIDRALETGRARGLKESQISQERRSPEFERAWGVPGLWCLTRTL